MLIMLQMDRYVEPIGGAKHPVGDESAVRAARDPDPLAVDSAQPNHVVDRRQEVRRIGDAPGGGDFLRERFVVAEASARVDEG
jgi:hypothetical protein